MPAKPRPTDPLFDADTEEACHLGALGYSTKMIERATGFTPCQVNYRLRQQGIKRKDYRDGNSEIAQLVLASTKKIVMAELREHYVATGKAALTYLRQNITTKHPSRRKVNNNVE